MGDKTGISWTEATWNPTVGCTIVSPGCTNCYAMAMAARLAAMGGPAGAKYRHLTAESKTGPVWNGDFRVDYASLDQPLRWRRPRMVFVNSMSDVFHEGATDSELDILFGIMLAANHHTYQVLTKRADRMKAWVDGLLDRTRHQYTVPALISRAANLLAQRGHERPAGDLWSAANRLARTRWPAPHIWLGVSTEDQKRADERVPLLTATQAAVRFVSAEPLLGGIDFGAINTADGLAPALAYLDWIIVGGESASTKSMTPRPMHLDWARSIRDQCRRSGTHFFFKQHGHFRQVADLDVDDPHGRRCDTIRTSNPTGRWLNLAGGHGFHGDRVVYIVPVGKKAAGDLLDGVQHHEFPGARA